MEDHLSPKRNSGNRQSFRASETIPKVQAKQNQYPNDRFKAEMPNLLYADFHHKITKNVNDNPPRHSRNHHKKGDKAIEEDDELVKYMSKLPSYLERGEIHKEKLLNFGVLDWGRLEKWQYQHKQSSERSSRHSLSSSSPSSSSFSIDESSVQSSTGQSYSPSRQRMRLRRPSLQCHLMSSPNKSHSQAVNSFEESISKFRDVETTRRSTLDEQGSFVRMDQPASSHRPDIKMDECKRKVSDQKVIPESGKVVNGVNYEAVAVQQMEAKAKIPSGEFIIKREGNWLERKGYDVDRKVSGKSETYVLLQRRDLPESNHADVPQCSKSTMMLGQWAAKASRRRSFLEMPREIGFAAVTSNVPHSCPLPRGLDDGRSEIKHCSKNASYSILPDASQSVPHPAKAGLNATRGKISEVKRSNIMATNLTLKEPSVGLEIKPSKVNAEKVRSTSPFRRLSTGMSKISKSFSSKEVSSTQKLGSACNPVKSGLDNAVESFCQDASNADMQNSTSRAWSSPLRRLLDSNPAKSGSQKATASFCRDASNGDTQNSYSRARLSPLRRLLDPLLKPKVPRGHQSGEPLKNKLLTTDEVCNSSNVNLDSSTRIAQPGKVKFDTPNCRTTDVDPSEGDKRESSAFQALFQVAVKNGQPLFTFAVENESDILAATMKKLNSSRENEYNCIYTFFSVQEVKKNNGRWINHGGKGKGLDYIPNVLAQLKVSSSKFSNGTGHNLMQHFLSREFVLYAVDLQQTEQRPFDSQPNDELAAIVVKIPDVISRSAISESRQTDNQSFMSATIILPSGIHSLPSKGGPSSLIQRWRSGGSCDCGGWDLGCKLTMLVNQNKLGKKSTSSKSFCSSDKFEFTPQGGEEGSQPVFSLAPFKDGIYSVEFNSSVSILQAFSICIAVLDIKELRDDSDSCNLVREKISLEAILSQNDGTRSVNGTDVDIPARFVSYPPLSPVGRV